MTEYHSNDRPPAIFLMGPTASGKTDLAVELVERLSCEIISVDSALIYRGMDIGTAKPDAELLARAPHRLIDIKDPAEAYSAAEFRDDALAAMAEITSAGRIPLLVGGTMMYFRRLLEGVAQLPPADQAVRQRLLEEAQQHGWHSLHARLASVDPVAAQRIHPNDPQRLQRALEVYEVSGRSLTAHWEAQQEGASAEQLPYNILSLAVAPAQRKTLHERIALRFRLMLEQGLVEEVRTLYARGDLDLNMPSMRAVGYRQVWEYLEGRWSYDEMVERGIIATRQLAKRQLTWLRSWSDLHWFVSEDAQLCTKVLKKVEPSIK